MRQPKTEEEEGGIHEGVADKEGKLKKWRSSRGEGDERESGSSGERYCELSERGKRGKQEGDGNLGFTASNGCSETTPARHDSKSIINF